MKALIPPTSLPLMQLGIQSLVQHQLLLQLQVGRNFLTFVLVFELSISFFSTLQFLPTTKANFYFQSQFETICYLFSFVVSSQCVIYSFVCHLFLFMVSPISTFLLYLNVILYQFPPYPFLFFPFLSSFLSFIYSYLDDGSQHQGYKAWLGELASNGGSSQQWDKLTKVEAPGHPRYLTFPSQHNSYNSRHKFSRHFLLCKSAPLRPSTMLKRKAHG